MWTITSILTSCTHTFYWPIDVSTDSDMPPRKDGPWLNTWYLNKKVQVPIAEVTTFQVCDHVVYIKHLLFEVLARSSALLAFPNPLRMRVWFSWMKIELSKLLVKMIAGCCHLQFSWLNPQHPRSVWPTNHGFFGDGKPMKPSPRCISREVPPWMCCCWSSRCVVFFVWSADFVKNHGSRPLFHLFPYCDVYIFYFRILHNITLDVCTLMYSFSEI